MKTTKQQITSGILRTGSFILMMFMFAQCEGPRGPQGFDGQNGQDGLDGTAFAYSAIYDVEDTEWEGDIDGYRVFLEVPEITEDIYYEGAVLVYRLIEIDPISFNMLPYTYVDNQFFIYLDFDAYIGGIDLIYKEVFEGANDTVAPEGIMSFKVVIIEGIPLATLKTMVDVSDINAVAKMLKVDLNKEGVQVF